MKTFLKIYGFFTMLVGFVVALFTLGYGEMVSMTLLEFSTYITLSALFLLTGSVVLYLGTRKTITII